MIHCRGRWACKKAAMARNLLSLCLLLPLAACGAAEQVVVASIPPDDYRVRHPIVLVEEPRKLEILVDLATGRFDHKTAAQLREFASLYRQFGRGPITIMPPVGPSGQLPTAPVRNALLRAGARTGIIVAPYPAGPNPVAPIRLSFLGLKAKVNDQCGQWPRDLGIGSGLAEDWSNKPYWNFGCASQSALAAQVADPRDLVTPQAETPADTVIRTRAIGNLRNGQDPSTSWNLDNFAISTVGVNQ
jgi:pilus assembly protein CpaD